MIRNIWTRAKFWVDLELTFETVLELLDDLGIYYQYLLSKSFKIHQSLYGCTCGPMPLGITTLSIYLIRLSANFFVTLIHKFVCLSICLLLCLFISPFVSSCVCLLSVQNVMLCVSSFSVSYFHFYDECHYANCCFAVCRYANCHYAQCCYAEC